jgi:N-acyl-D-amino-acid deacylase
MLDVLLRGGTVVDGTGVDPVRADVGIARDRILLVGEGRPEDAETVLDCGGLIVAPGFIDLHSHTDTLLLAHPQAESKLAQGVTTDIGGNCGASPGPWLSEFALAQGARWTRRNNIEPTWRRLGEFFALLDGRHFGINYAAYVGHGPLRASFLGYEQRAPTDKELAAMRQVLAEEMQAGALGLSTGLIYPPGCYADRAELIALGQVVAAHDGVYATHMRDEGDFLVEAVEEALAVGYGAGCAIQISHHKACGQVNWGKVETTLGMLDEARAAGIDAHSDQYPYDACSTGLGALLPTWVHEGGAEAALTRLRQPETRIRILHDLRESAATGAIAGEGGWSCNTIAYAAKHRWAEGLNLEEVATHLGVPVEEAVLALLEEEEMQVGVVQQVMSERDVETVMRHPATLFGSDGQARPAAGPLAQGKIHPRAFGTYPRILGRYVRDRGVLSLPEAVAKMTSRVARKVGLAERGQVAPGFFADLCVFDPELVMDHATYADPFLFPQGILHVFVNGRAAVLDGHHTGEMAGRVLRRGARQSQ